MTTPKFDDLAEVGDADIAPIVLLLKQDQRSAAYARFYQLCASIRGLDLNYEAQLLAGRIFQQARAA